MAMAMIKTAADYHRSTSYDRHQLGGHFLDRHNQPRLVKKYPGLIPLMLPEATGLPQKASLWDLISDPGVKQTMRRLDLAGLATILFLSNTHTARNRHSAGTFYYRSAASAGALYPNEIYLAAYGIAGLDAGIYHYGIADMSLTCMRKGSFRSQMAEATGLSDAGMLQATFLVTAIFYRSAWKYRARAFRYALLDGGHVLENLILALQGCGFAFNVGYDFDDAMTAKLIGVDGQKEACLARVHVSGEASPAKETPAIIEPLPQEVIAASMVDGQAVEYPEIQAAYHSGSRIPDDTPAETEMISSLGLEPEESLGLKSKATEKEALGYVEALLQRRSNRNFVRRPLAAKQAQQLLALVRDAASQAIPRETSGAMAIGFLNQDVEGWQPGFYLLDPKRSKMAPVVKGDLTGPMARACLGQDWLQNAALQFLFLTNLSALDKAYGPRGYRYAMLHAGRIGQAIYLGATALGKGCCGVGAFFDGEAQKLLGLEPDAVLLYLVAVGHVKKLR